MKDTIDFGLLRTWDLGRLEFDGGHLYVAPSEAHNKKMVSGPACACAVCVWLLDGESQVRARGGPALGFKGSSR